MADAPFFRLPFALEGDQEAIPQALQPTGDVSFQTGYGFDYERDPEKDPTAKDIERTKMNWLFWAITSALRQYQTYGAYPYITPEQNDGKPYPYNMGARCVYGEGLETSLYESLVENNTAQPTDGTKWMRINGKDFVPSTRKIITGMGLAGGGSLDTDVMLQANYLWSAVVKFDVPCLVIGADGKVYQWKAPSGPGTSAGPKAPGAAGSEAFWKWVVTDYATPPTAATLMFRDGAGRAQVAAPSVPADVTNKGYVDGQNLLAGTGYQIFPGGLVVQWGAQNPIPYGSPVTFPIAFPTACDGVAITVSSVTDITASTYSVGAVATKNNFTPRIKIAATGVATDVAAYWFAWGR